MELKEILIVDEQFPMLENLQRILLDWGYVVILAPNARAALEALPGHRFDLILVSLNGYEEDKLNLLRWARRNSAQPKLMVVGYAKVTLPMEVFRIKVDDYLLPPFTAQELSTRVERCLNKDEVTLDITETGDERIDNIINSFEQEFVNIHNGLLSLKSKFYSFIDQEINAVNNISINKINDISNEMHLLINITESILYNLLTCYNEKEANSAEKTFLQEFFKQNKSTQLH